MPPDPPSLFTPHGRTSLKYLAPALLSASVSERISQWAPQSVSASVIEHISQWVHQSDGQTRCTSDDSGKAENWTGMIDRGGLFHVSETTYTLFHAMEEEVCDHLRKMPAHKITDGFKQKLISSIASNEDVLFYWSILSADADEEDAQTLLKMVIELWITICGFAFASSWIEMYKQASKKTIQRSKALRRNLQDSSSATDWPCIIVVLACTMIDEFKVTYMQ